MAKTKTTKKKLEDSEIINDIEKTVSKKKKGEFQVYIKINDTETEVTTDDIAGAIISVFPEFPKTPLTVRVTKDGKTLDRYIQLQQAKRLSYDKITMESFIKNLIF